jgi:hypothetical protein
MQDQSKIYFLNPRMYFGFHELIGKKIYIIKKNMPVKQEV